MPTEMLKHHEALDLRLRQRASRLFTDFLAFADDARRAIDEGLHQRFGYLGEADYFEERIGVSYRALSRYLGILDRVLALPPAEQPELRAALATIGVHKAGVLRPVIGREGENWRWWAERAASVTEEALQEEISAAVGARPRGRVAEPGERFLAFMLSHMPPEEKEHVEAVLLAVMKLAGTTNPVGGFLRLIQIAEVELAGHGIHL